MSPNLSVHEKAEILSEALPYMQRHDDAIIVVKYGGHAMGNEQVARDFARDIVLLEQAGLNPVVVHGGGPQISEMLQRLGIKSEFAAGHRITDAASVEVVEMVLAGSINKQLVGFINAEGGRAVGLSRQGRQHADRQEGDAHHRTIRIPTSRRWSTSASSASPTRSTRTVLDQVIRSDIIPVLAPVAASADGGTFNVNADTFAGAIAGALGAKRLLLLTDVPGMLDKDKS